MTVPFFPVVIFSSDSWCLYFDMTEGYLRRPDDCTFFSGSNFSSDSWCLDFDTTDSYLRWIKFGGEVSIGDTREHPLGVYLEKESLYFNIT
jgi:hypothetical protein